VRTWRGFSGRNDSFSYSGSGSFSLTYTYLAFSSYAFALIAFFYLFFSFLLITTVVSVFLSGDLSFLIFSLGGSFAD